MGRSWVLVAGPAVVAAAVVVVPVDEAAAFDLEAQVTDPSTG